MSIAVTPIVRALVSAATRGKARTRPTTETAADNAAENDAPLPEATRARRVAWTLVLLVGWGFSYSLGWSKGWTAAAADADARFEAINQCMINLPGAQGLWDPVGDPARAADAVETATAAEQGAGGARGAGGSL